MTTSIIRAGGTGVPGVQTTGGDDGALALKVGPLAATVEALSITTAGSVGIGTAAPGTEGTNVRLAIVGTASQQASSLATSDTNAGFTVRGNSSSGYLLAIGATNNSSQPYIQAVNYNGGAASAALSIQPYGGNVGIGTTAPASTLDVSGTLDFTSLTPESTLTKTTVQTYTAGTYYDLTGTVGALTDQGAAYFFKLIVRSTGTGYHHDTGAGTITPVYWPNSNAGIITVPLMTHSKGTTTAYIRQKQHVSGMANGSAIMQIAFGADYVLSTGGSINLYLKRML